MTRRLVVIIVLGVLALAIAIAFQFSRRSGAGDRCHDEMALLMSQWIPAGEHDAYLRGLLDWAHPEAFRRAGGARFVGGVVDVDRYQREVIAIMAERARADGALEAHRLLDGFLHGLERDRTP
jgi:hypothetical protein